MKRVWLVFALLLSTLALVAAACGGDEEAAPPAAPAEPAPAEPAPAEPAPAAAEDFGEQYDADPALLQKALGTTDNVPEPVLAAVYRAGLPADIDLAIKCWKDKVCETGTGGELTVALADGFGENVWREVTHMEFVLQALTYPEIGKIIYTSGQADTQKAISDLRSLIAQDVDIIVGFPDAGEAMLPTIKEATDRGILYVPYLAAPGGEAGTDFLAFVSEDLCQLGENFATVLKEEVGTGKVAFLGGTPGNGLSAAWQGCEKPALGSDLQLVGKADTNWTREGTLEAMSGFLSSHPDLKGVSYEYADGFLGGVRAYEAAGLPLDLVLTLRTDEFGLFCQWKDIGNPNFKIFYSSGGGFDSRIALTSAMMKLAGAEIPGNVVVPASMRQVDDSTCNPNVPGESPASTLVPDEVLAAMYPA